jgi:fibronectin-binding autotransporter adhesin
METNPTNSNSGAFLRLIHTVFPAVLLSAMLLLLTIQSAHAGSATWQVFPPSTDWNDPVNWTLGGPPNGPSDTATFSFTQGPNVFVFSSTEVNEIIFDSTPYTIEVTYPNGISLISGAGITNNSGVTQTFLVHGQLFLQNNAAIGDSVSMETGSGGSGYVQFSGNATAGGGVFTLDPGIMAFYGNATAGDGVFAVNGFTFCGSGNGSIGFSDNASAGNGTFTLNGGAICGNEGGGFIIFSGTSTAGDAVFTLNGGTNSGELGGVVSFDGGTESGPSAGNATLIANGGSGGGTGGSIQFFGASVGGTSRMELFGNSTLLVDLLYIPSLTIGSIEGAGTVSLNLAVGSNNLSTTFSGIIQEVTNGPCSLTKIGRGKLTLSSANTYTGGTTVMQGSLLVTNTTGSGTGAGAVSVNGGIFGGTGMVSGPVTIGTARRGATLAPGSGRNPGRLTTTSSLRLNGRGVYQVDLNSTRRTADQISANGVTLASGSTITVTDSGTTVLTSGTVFVIINNTASTPIAGRFSNLADGSTLTVGNNTYLVSYEGGSGNDLTLTVP